MLPVPATRRGIFNNNRDSIVVNLSEYQGRGKGLKGEEKCAE
jgi:hypothetical protein